MTLDFFIERSILPASVGRPGHQRQVVVTDQPVLDDVATAVRFRRHRRAPAHDEAAPAHLGRRILRMVMRSFVRSSAAVGMGAMADQRTESRQSAVGPEGDA